MDELTDASETSSENGKARFPSCRLVLMVIGFFTYVNFHTLRVDLSVAIVAMVNTTHLRKVDAAVLQNTSQQSALSDQQEQCANDRDSNTTREMNDDNEGTFVWDEQTQGIILGAFYYGYTATQIIGGIVAQKIGGKPTILFGLSSMSVLTLLTPVLTTVGDFGVLIAIRVLLGMGGGVMYGSMVSLLSRWAPPLERSKMSTIIYAGFPVGLLVGMQVSGVLCKDLGWEYTFYVFGGLGVLCSVLWFFLIYNSPAEHPRISVEERSHIEKALNTQQADEKGTLRLPWLSIAKSLPFYALIMANMAIDWSYCTLLAVLPQYFKHILHFDIQSNGLLSGVPYLLMFFFTFFSGILVDLIRTKKILSTTNVRKLALTVGSLIPAGCLVATGYVSCNVLLAVILIIAAIGFSGITTSCWTVNHLDLAPRYAGTLIGITNTFGSLTGFMGPAVVGALTNGNQTVEAWRAVFYISGAVYVFGVIFYGLFGSGEMQPWATPKLPDETILNSGLWTKHKLASPADVNVISGLEEGSKNRDDLVVPITTPAVSEIFGQKEDDKDETNFDTTIVTRL